jgi:hypothetical protein
VIGFLNASTSSTTCAGSSARTLRYSLFTVATLAGGQAGPEVRPRVQESRRLGAAGSAAARLLTSGIQRILRVSRLIICAWL